VEWAIACENGTYCDQFQAAIAVPALRVLEDGLHPKGWRWAATALPGEAVADPAAVRRLALGMAELSAAP
jgi:hypothetical protein